MPLTIKDERVAALASELAAMTGESITEAVGHAIEARLSELRRRKSREEGAQRLMEIGRKCAREAPKDWLTRDFDAELYGDKCLPR